MDVIHIMGLYKQFKLTSSAESKARNNLSEDQWYITTLTRPSFLSQAASI